MSSNENNDQKKKKVGGLWVSSLCHVLGMIILLVVIASCMPLIVPQIMGYQVYNVVSGSMEPAVPIGSIIYVKAVSPDELVPGDIIAFSSGESVIMHRVINNKIVEGTLTTKGDANEGEDLNDIDYAAVIGRVDKHFPVLGQLLILYSSNIGRVYLFCFAACGALLNLLGSRLSKMRNTAKGVDLEKNN